MQFLYPVPKTSIVTQTYQDHVDVANKNGWCSQPGMGCKTYYYGGIDWAVPLGTPVKAAQSGTVETKTETTGYGTHVRILHDGGYLTIYGHLSRLNCRTGDKVKAGDVVGYSGSTGNSTGPHLHFEVRKNNKPIDPQPMLEDSIADEGGVSGGTTPPVSVVLPTIPKLPKMKVVTTVPLTIRKSPSKVDLSMGSLQPNTIVEITNSARDMNGNTWLSIGYNQWVAYFFDNEYYLEEVK